MSANTATASPAASSLDRVPKLAITPSAYLPSQTRPWGDAIQRFSPPSRPGWAGLEEGLLGPRELLVGDPVRPVGFGAEPLVPVLLVGLEVALEPDDLRVALVGQDVGRHAVEEPAIVGDDHGAA